MKMPTISLKFIVGVQWMLVMWASHWGTFSGSYNWTNVFVLAIAIWAIADKQSVDAIFMYMILLVISIIVDIVVLSLFFDFAQSGFLKFSVGMAIVNLILKPFIILLLYQMYKDRGGEYNINFGQNNTTYDNIGAEENNMQGSAANFNPPLITKS